MVIVQILSCIRHGRNVKRALEKTTVEINESLSKIQGKITMLDANILSGISGATARVVVTVDESDYRTKYLLWANEAGGSEETALRRAREKLNSRLSKIRGDIVGFYMKFITPPIPKRTYASLIVAVNEEISDKVGKLSSEERRERLAALLRLLGNNPKTINLAQVARTFGVSRDTIYKDLQELGADRLPETTRR